MSKETYTSVISLTDLGVLVVHHEVARLSVAVKQDLVRALFRVYDIRVLVVRHQAAPAME